MENKKGVIYKRELAEIILDHAWNEKRGVHEYDKLDKSFLDEMDLTDIYEDERFVMDRQVNALAVESSFIDTFTVGGHKYELVLFPSEYRSNNQKKHNADKNVYKDGHYIRWCVRKVY